jgi:hypothetical protein
VLVCQGFQIVLVLILQPGNVELQRLGLVSKGLFLWWQ